MIYPFGLARPRLQLSHSKLSLFLFVAAGVGLLTGCDAPGEFPASVKAERLMEAPIAAEPVIIKPAPAPVPAAGRGTPRRGVVTAGDIDDALNLAAFRRYQAQASGKFGLPRLRLGGAVQAQLTGPDGKPAPGVPITLRKPGASDPFYSGYSGVDGRIAIFPAELCQGAPNKVELRAFGDGQNMVNVTLPAGKPQQIALPFKGNWSPDFLDLVFVIDVSGSMGDELAWLTKEFGGIVKQMRRTAPGTDLRFGLVAYQSPGDAFAVKNFGFTKQTGTMQHWLRSLNANGGSGGDEVVGKAMAVAVGLPWRRGQGERLVFQIGDEPPNQAGMKLLLRSASKAAKTNVQIFGLGASGTEESLEYLMRHAALVTGGRYLFLTDDSGVGLPHGEPKIACYRVTSLKSLLNRVLASELTGHRSEAGKGEIVRDVGNYRRGVCLQ